MYELALTFLLLELFYALGLNITKPLHNAMMTAHPGLSSPSPDFLILEGEVEGAVTFHSESFQPLSFAVAILFNYRCSGTRKEACV
jgi:hypothetical protein